MRKARISLLGRKRKPESWPWYHAFECTAESPSRRESRLRGRSKHQRSFMYSTLLCTRCGARGAPVGGESSELRGRLQLVGRAK